jgi:hypothetical protein
MDCRKMERYLSPYLDGELASEDMQMVQFHLRKCAACRRQYDELVLLVSVVKHMGSEVIPAPHGFSDAVMQQLYIENRPLSITERTHKLVGKWKPAVAATAAALLITLAGLGIRFIPVSQTAHNNHVNQPQTVVADKGNSVNDQTRHDQLPDSPAVTPSRPETTKTENNSTDSALDPLTDDQVLNYAMSSSPVFLNKERVIKTTMLKLKVADPDAASEQATKIAATSGASTQNLGQQVNENGTCWVLRITGAKSSAPNLLASLSSLGTVSSQDVDKVDIAAQFAQTLNQYQNLIAERDKIQDAGRKAQLDGQIIKLERELETLEASADKETIVLWLQK